MGQFVSAISEQDFDRMHKMEQSVYKKKVEPPLVGDIREVIRMLEGREVPEVPHDVDFIVARVVILQRQKYQKSIQTK